jgi:multimeric flavodoxin WrbA
MFSPHYHFEGSMMGSVAIIYFSGTGNTHLMAEAIASGVHRHADTRVDLLRIEGIQIKDGRWFDEKFMESLQMADAILFGSPTYMVGLLLSSKHSLISPVRHGLRNLGKIN